MSFVCAEVPAIFETPKWSEPRTISSGLIPGCWEWYVWWCDADSTWRKGCGFFRFERVESWRRCQ
jgi:hypothetical protein